MKKIINILLISVISISLLSSTLSAQPPKWYQLPNAPLAGTHARFVDLYFVNSLTGYILRDGDGAFKTTNGGSSFSDITNGLASGGRSIGFFDENTGIVGMLNNNDTLIMRTSNGGNSWVKINNISGNIPKGICGISIVNSTTAFGTGRYYKPANLIRTTDKGLSWVSIPIDSTLITSAVDCHFWSADSGVVVGGFSENGFLTGNAVIVRTTNGGASFTRTHFSSVDSAWCWKVQFLNRSLGYASIESRSIAPYLKTTDGGATWMEKPFNNDIDQEGIGFINENTGWIGGWGTSFGGMPTYETTDAGASWHLAGYGKILNRVRFLNDTLAYASGQSVYKFSKNSVGITQITSNVPDNFSLGQNYPNPFNPSTKINYEVKITGPVKLTVYDNGGSAIHTLVNEVQQPGKYSVNFDALHLASGIYFYKLVSDKFSETKKMILVK